jgi:hypothetical protein
MKGISKNKSLSDRQTNNEEEKKLQGYPIYPANEDIYSKYQKEKEINPEDTSKTKDLNKKSKIGASNEKDFNDDVSGNDLDIPGSELDDNQEIIGSDDEENNYYSLGGDDHCDLEENKGE